MNRRYVITCLSIFGIVLLAWIILLPKESDSQQSPPQLYEGVPFDANLLALDRRALDEAYHQQIVLLFSIWIKQQAKDATQITAGLQLARRAYNQAAGQIAKREQQLHDDEQRRTSGAPK